MANIKKLGPIKWTVIKKPFAVSVWIGKYESAYGWDFGYESEYRTPCVEIQLFGLRVLYIEIRKGFEVAILGFWWAR